MNARIRRTTIVSALVAVCCVISSLFVASAMAEPPIKEILSGHVGWEVDKTTGGGICTVESKDVCQPGRESGEPGGFVSPRTVAVDGRAADPAHYGHVYVAESGNDRVQELTAAGAFVSMFGWDVNRTKVEAGGATQAEKNVCSEEEVKGAGVRCQAGVAGPEAGMFDDIASIAVDPASGEVYVGEVGNHRVDAYTPDGTLLWSFAGFNDPSESSVLSAGGPEHLLYVANDEAGEGRVQELEADGTLEREVSVAGVVTAIAVDATSGEMYVVYGGEDRVRKLTAAGVQLAEFAVAAGPSNAIEDIGALALDSAGHLAVSAREEGPGIDRWFGSLLQETSGELQTEFSGAGPAGFAFGPGGELYAAASSNSISGTGHEVLEFRPVHVAELSTRPASCAVGEEHETDVTLACSLNGQVDPWGVSDTEVWFEWGRTSALGESTPAQMLCTTVCANGTLLPVSARVVVRPNESSFYYRLAGRDDGVQPPERALSSFPVVSFTTPIVAPMTIGEAVVSFVKSSSAVMSGELNPENARTDYFFEYAPEGKSGETLGERCPKGIRSEGCAGVASTPVKEASCPRLTDGGAPQCVYQEIGATLEASGLQSATVYRYRMFAESESIATSETTGEKEKLSSLGEEGSFQTAPAPSVMAQSGVVSMVGATGATVSGIVDPVGQPATYAFELGVYEGAATRYGIVFSGPADASATPTEVSLALTGLQPGTTYTYRIRITSGYGSATGAPVTFTTLGLPAVLNTAEPLPMLPTPPIAFPNGAKPAPKCKHGYTRDKHEKCVIAKRRGSKRKHSKK